MGPQETNFLSTTECPICKNHGQPYHHLEWECLHTPDAWHLKEPRTTVYSVSIKSPRQILNGNKRHLKIYTVCAHSCTFIILYKALTMLDSKRHDQRLYNAKNVRFLNSFLINTNLCLRQSSRRTLGFTAWISQQKCSVEMFGSRLPLRHTSGTDISVFSGLRHSKDVLIRRICEANTRGAIDRRPCRALVPIVNLSISTIKSPK